MRLARQTGFTLLEILVALSVFAVMAVLTFGSMDRIINYREQVQTNTEELQQLQMAFAIVKNDIAQSINRPIRDNLGTTRPGFFSNPNDEIRLAVTTQSRSHLELEPNTSRMQRIEYRLENNQLIRDIWPNLDRAHNTEAQSQVLFDEVASVEFEFINKQEHSFWPLPDGHLDYRDLPRAVRVTFTLQSEKQLERLFLLSSI